jgi:hypothetical protein
MMISLEIWLLIPDDKLEYISLRLELAAVYVSSEFRNHPNQVDDNLFN